MKNKWSGILLSLLAALDLLFLFYYNYPAVEMNPYLLRDVQRAMQILEGVFVWVGPDFTSGSYVPGPLHYLILLPILAVSKTPFAVVGFALVFKVFAQLIFSVAFRPVMRMPAAIIYLVISSSAFLLERFIWINNSSFIAPFLQILAVLLLWYWQSRDHHKELWWVGGIALFTGLCIQTHFSMAFVVPVVFLFILEKAKKTNSRALRELVFLGSLSLLMMAPFVVAYLNDKVFHIFDGPVFFNSQLGVREFTKDWGRLFGRKWKVFHDVNIFDIEVLVAFAYLTLKALRVFFKTKTSPKTVMDKIWIYTGTGALVFMAWILSGSYMRYFTVFFVPALVGLLYDSYHFLIGTLRNKKLPVFLLMLVSMMILRHEFHFFPKNSGKQGKCEACIYQMSLLCDYFNSRKISFEQFSMSTYEFFPTDSHGSLYYLEHCFEKKKGVDPQEQARYLFVDSDFLAEPEVLTEMVRKIPAELRSFYADRAKYQEAVVASGFTFFRVAQDEPLLGANRYSNLAYAYELDPGVGERAAIKGIAEGVERLYKASFCDSAVFCDLYVTASQSEGEIEVGLHSRLFQTKTELRPLVGRAEGLKLEFQCDEQTRAVDVASVLGMILEEQQNETLFTPLRLKVSADCKEWSFQAVQIDRLEVSSNNTQPQVFERERFQLHRL